MHPIRCGYLVGGLLVIVAVAWEQYRHPEASEVAPLLFLSWGFLALLGEVVIFARSLPRRRERQLPDHARPADGDVGLAHMEGVTGIPSPIDPRFRRFDGQDAAWRGTPLIILATRREPPPLLGRVVWVSLFQGRDGRGWSDEEIVRAHEALRRAGLWIEREAQRWGAPVNIELADTYFVADDHQPDDVEIAFQPEGNTQGPFEARAQTKALIGMSRAAALLGFHDAVDWIARVNPRLVADVVVWLVHPRRAGRSFAVPLDRTELAGVSLAICYAREADFPEPLRQPPYTDPATIAHELLHLFDATDKYGVPLRSFPPQTVTSHDIMRLSHDQLARLRIDPRTASEIGWNPINANGRRASGEARRPA